jgi:hypothetical protein
MMERLDTERLSAEECADEIMEPLGDPAFQETPQSQRAAAAAARHIVGG